jgi:hypothetical protein
VTVVVCEEAPPHFYSSESGLLERRASRFHRTLRHDLHWHPTPVHGILCVNVRAILDFANVGLPFLLSFLQSSILGVSISQLWQLETVQLLGVPLFPVVPFKTVSN